MAIVVSLGATSCGSPTEQPDKQAAAAPKDAPAATAAPTTVTTAAPTT